MENQTGGSFSRPSPFRNKWLYLLVAALLAGWWWISGGEDENTDGRQAVRVTVAPVARRDVPMDVELVGTVVAYESVAVKSRLDSQVTGVLFADGDTVREGQVLFELDDRAIKAQIKELEAGVAKEKAQLVNVRLQYERAQKLAKTNTVAQAQVDSARAAFEAQAAQVSAVQAVLDTAKVQLTYTTITAPISGRAGTINVTRGNNVRAGDVTPLVTINQVSPIRVQFSIPQRYYDDIRAVMQKDRLPVMAQRSEGVDDPAEGTLEYLDNAIDPGSGTFAARAVFANQDEKLWPGMFVRVTLRLGIRENALTVPSVAVQGDEGRHFVFAADTAANKAVRTPVQVTQNTGNVAIISDGLKENQQVIVDGLLRVTDGGAIEIVDAAAEESAAEISGDAP